MPEVSTRTADSAEIGEPTPTSTPTATALATDRTDEHGGKATAAAGEQAEVAEVDGEETRSAVEAIQERDKEALRNKIIVEIEQLAVKLKRVPRAEEFRAASAIPWTAFKRVFPMYATALGEAGFDVSNGYPLSMEQIFTDWMGVVKKLGKVPSVREYAAHGKHTRKALMKRFRLWSNLPPRLMEFAARTGREEQWKETLELVREHVSKPRVNTDGAWLDTREPGAREDKPVYGRPIRVPGMCCAPVNEQGVVGLFMCLAHRLGFEVRKLQTAFPDCEAMRRVAKDKWQDCIIEFEEESREFLKHGHDPKKCDLIVCWKHNWKECPIEVLCLEEVLEKLFATNESATSF